MALKSKVRSKKPKALQKKGLRLRRKKVKEIVIDREAGLVFPSEKALVEHFRIPIEKLEQEYSALVRPDDLREEEIANFEDELDLTLEQPAEIWHDAQTFADIPVFHFVRPIEALDAFHIAVAYVNTEDEPSFIFLHFVTKHLELVDNYRRGDLVYDLAFEEVGFGMLDGDALSEGDPLAMGLFIAMLKLRGEKDVPYEKFAACGDECREDTIQNADEIWRSTDLHGNQIVTFIKEFPDSDVRDLFYIAITQEDTSSQMHSLLFSFPTNDENLVDRYRHGENLQAEEVSQESSH
ncbi:MAG: PBECR2 nuclease fold domain-containing protein [Bdellovibrio sp.]